MIYSASVDAAVIRLQPLTAEDSEALLAALIGPLISPFKPALRDLLTRRAAGNPFFIEEAVRSLIDTDFYKLLMAQSVFRSAAKEPPNRGFTR